MNRQPFNKWSKKTLSAACQKETMKILEEALSVIKSNSLGYFRAAPIGSAFLSKLQAPFSDIDIVVNLDSHQACLDTLAVFSKKMPYIAIGAGSTPRGGSQPWFKSVMINSIVNLILVDSLPTFKGYVFAQSVVQQFRNPSKACRCLLFETIIPSNPRAYRWDGVEEDYLNESRILSLVETQLAR